MEEPRRSGGADALGAVDFVPSPGGFIGFAGRAIGHAFLSSFVSSSSPPAGSAYCPARTICRR